MNFPSDYTLDRQTETGILEVILDLGNARRTNCVQNLHTKAEASFNVPVWEEGDQV